MPNIDTFFNTGVMAAAEEIHDDIQTHLATPLGSQFYNRRMGNGIHLQENAPLGAVETMLFRYEIANCLAHRNQVTQKKLQAVVSQNHIRLTRKKDTLDIDVTYIPVENVTLEKMLMSILRM
jgi:phage baseplate assembly protein W